VVLRSFATGNRPIVQNYVDSIVQAVARIRNDNRQSAWQRLSLGCPVVASAQPLVAAAAHAAGGQPSLLLASFSLFLCLYPWIARPYALPILAALFVAAAGRRDLPIGIIHYQIT
jgi:hypothetical protein